jgi:hypothetical protein
MVLSVERRNGTHQFVQERKSLTEELSLLRQWYGFLYGVARAKILV